MEIMGYYTTRMIYPWLYSIFDPQAVFCYLAVGNEKALLFDTGYGIGNLPVVIKEITDKPVTIVLGHGHIDHANGAYQFHEVWLHESDFELYYKHTSEDFRKNILDELARKGQVLPEGFDRSKYMKEKVSFLRKLDIGHVFDLGNLHMEVVSMEGHTAGSIGLLAQERKVLLDSDSANPHIWMFLTESLSVHAYIAMLERMLQLDFNVFFVGHNDAPMPKSYFNKFINVARNASLEKAKPYNAIPELKGFIYQEEDTAIVFSEDTLK
jgi:glyoxylase-like metal-dependent hydrolase (beta-lactamase superfamily II)